MELLIRYEDEALIAVEKPAGFHTAPLRAGEDDTLVAAVIERYPEIARLPGRKGVEPGLLHRLDRETSGLVLFARSAASFERLWARSEAGELRKEYLALCRAGERPSAGGEAAPGALLDRLAGASAGRITVKSRFAPFGPGRKRVRVIPVAEGEGGRTEGRREVTARLYVTELELLGSSGELRLVRARITRGFRHQIRAHLAYLGAPILGDPLYGPEVEAAGSPVSAPESDRFGPLAFRRMYLHACAIELLHPFTGERLLIRSPLPREFDELFPGAFAS